MQNKKRLFVLAACVVILGAVGVSVIPKYTNKEVLPTLGTPTPEATSSPRTKFQTRSAPTQPITQTVQVVVMGTTYTAAIIGQEPVAQVMQELASTTLFRYTAKDYPGMGLFVDSINGTKNTGGNYWMLYVNGEQSLVGVSQKIIQPGDIVEWKYE